jgi:hypothetical protein
MKVFEPLSTTDEFLVRVQRAVSNGFQKLFTLAPILNGRLVEDLALSTSTTMLEHGLGRRPLGFIVVRSSAAQTVYVYEADNTIPDRTLPLRAGGSVTCSLWVF